MNEPSIRKYLFRAILWGPWVEKQATDGIYFEDPEWKNKQLIGWALGTLKIKNAVQIRDKSLADARNMMKRYHWTFKIDSKRSVTWNLRTIVEKQATSRMYFENRLDEWESVNAFSGKFSGDRFQRHQCNEYWRPPRNPFWKFMTQESKSIPALCLKKHL